MTQENINWIKDTPLGVNVRRISFVAPHAHEDMIEITMCLEGCITFDYCFEEFRLKEGEFILVDRDTHYLHSGDDALCASFYIDLKKMSDSYGDVCNQMFVCEGTAESTVPHNTQEHKNLRGMLIAVLDYLLKSEQTDESFEEDITRAAESIMNQIYYRFDYINWRNPDQDITEKMLLRMKTITAYLFRHYAEKICLQDLADQIDVSKGYMSALLSRNSIGFEEVLAYVRSWRAERLLLTTDMSIADISEESGFSATKYMYSAFNYWYHCTPREYRLKYQREMKKKNRLKEVSVKEAREQIIKLTNEQLILMYIKRED